MRHLDSHAIAKLQAWLSTRVDPVTPEIKLLVVQLHEFAWQVHCEGLEAVLTEKSADAADLTTAVELFERIADLLCREVSPTERAVAMKSLQESLFVSTDVEPDATPTFIAQRFERYLEVNGSKGLLRIFLSSHVLNTILLDLHDSLQTSDLETLKTRIAVIERLCQSAAGVLVRSWGKWPRLTQALINSSVRTAAAEMKKAINSKTDAARPR